MRTLALRHRGAVLALPLALFLSLPMTLAPSIGASAPITITRSTPGTFEGFTFVEMLLMRNDSTSNSYGLFMALAVMNFLLGQPFKLHGPGTDALPPGMMKSQDSTDATTIVDGALVPHPASAVTAAFCPSGSVALHPSRRYVYSAASGGSFGVVCAARYDADSRMLVPIAGSPFRAGVGTEAVAVDPSGTFLYAANMDDGTVSPFSIDPATGALSAIVGATVTSGKDPRAIAVDPSGRFVYVANNTTNASAASISGFAINAATGALTALPGSPWATPSGPSGLAIEPGGRYLYVAAASIQAYSIDATTGALTAIGAPASPFATRIAADPSGRFVYATSNGLNRVSAYAIGANGVLSAVGAGAATGTNPVGVAVDPTGRFVYTANLLSDNVSGFAIDPSTGGLSVLPGFPVAAGSTPLDLVLMGSLPGRAAALLGSRFFFPIAIAGGYPPYAWSVASGNLPPGLSLDARLGAVQGTPTTRGDFSFVAQATDSRGAVADKSVTISVVPQAVRDATKVLEYYNGKLDNFFITSDLQEALAIDLGNAGPGWYRTGEFFQAGGASQVCRFYGSISPGPNSHFYTIDPNECAALKQLQQTTPATSKRWNFESLDFASTVPAGGNCAAGFDPVYRAYNDGFARGVDSNHRITRSASAITQVVAGGWKNEGVVMCAPSP